MTYKYYLSSRWNLYDNQNPLIIPCPRRSKEILASWMINRITASDFHGLFAKEAV